MTKDQKKRQNLSLRFQSHGNTPLGRVLKWLKSLDLLVKKDKTERLLLSFLPYALEAEGKTKEEVENCYWDVHQRLQDYLFVMRQTLNIQVPISPGLSTGVGINANFVEKPADLVKPEEIGEEEEEEEISFSDVDLMF